MNLQVSFGGQLLKEIQDIQPAMNLARTRWYFDDIRFTPDHSSGLLEFTPADPVIPRVGHRHRLPFHQAFIHFTPDWEEVDLQISHVQIGVDETLLIDNVRIVHGTRTPPVITQSLMDQLADSAETVVFTLFATGNNLSDRWLLDGVDLADGPFITGLNTPTLTLENVQPAQAGIYSVLVTDGLGVVGSAASLTVIEVPSEEVPLAVRMADGLVVIAWPIDAWDFRLQFAPSLPTDAAGRAFPGLNTLTG
jgi:hypothetical protein